MAANHLRTAARGCLERQEYTFARFEDELRDGAAEPANDLRYDPEFALALEEVKVGCTLGMLLCLHREHRLAYIVGEILEIDSSEAAGILDVTPAAFRQRLSRARRAIIEFTSRVCGIVREENGCHCRRRVAPALAGGRIRLGAPLFGTELRASAARFADVEHTVRALDEMRRAAAVYRAHPDFAAPAALRDQIRALLGTLQNWG